MKIKNRLALNFTLISSGAMLLMLVGLYLSFYSFVKLDFYDRLSDRAKTAAQLYLKADEISSDSLDRLQERYLQRLPQEVIRIYDERNAAKFIKDNQQYWSSSTINQVRKNKYIQFTDGQEQVVGMYYHDDKGKFVILASAYDAEGAYRMSRLTITMMLTFLFTNIILFVTGRWFAQRSLAPVNDVVKQMQLITASNLHLRVNEGNSKDEISQLARNFNRLLEHLQNAFELQQTFVANASHELRTPVTSITGEVEIALNKPRSTEEYQQTLKSVLADSVRLTETISGLLELAKADMQYTQAQLSPVAIDDLIWELSDYWSHRLGKGLLSVQIIHLPEDQNKLLLPANKALLTIALNNIIGNAFKFSNNQPVVCSLYADDKQIKIDIQDKGIGIPDEDIRKVFTSFYRSPNGRGFQGSGIGLYVTQKIIQLFSGTIDIHSVPYSGTTFHIRFSH
ncbi:HAMP domain-containing protein [Mucilaginibacter robiniae]|uniref:histidine kinase n=1 Tax=Mucilaginibacter robiniae TaxID=2728022 RepID=A0A7L5E1K6_9SPHI|nr:sensor histidine kinase [Mucilaginibacter robiniae]QJD97055.1 HAMP domain-containing protein [Mucilaginibacter robiniae]